ncbi:MAG TPA: hypothetical protein VGE64_07350 [Xanthomonadaceae bacterium]
MTDISEQERILAQAIFEIRVLLSGYLDSSAKDHLHVREAAFLAYALHNQALESLSGKAFDTNRALAAIASVDTKFHSNLVQRFANAGITSRA